MEILANGGLGALLFGVLLCASTNSGAETDAENEELPDLEFLEYLGLWEETDIEWLLLDEEEVADNNERNDPVPEGKESTETDDES
jgi:hypothetical protein